MKSQSDVMALQLNEGGILFIYVYLFFYYYSNVDKKLVNNQCTRLLSFRGTEKW